MRFCFRKMLHSPYIFLQGVRGEGKWVIDGLLIHWMSSASVKIDKLLTPKVPKWNGRMFPQVFPQLFSPHNHLISSCVRNDSQYNFRLQYVSTMGLAKPRHSLQMKFVHFLTPKHVWRADAWILKTKYRDKAAFEREQHGSADVKASLRGTVQSFRNACWLKSIPCLPIITHMKIGPTLFPNFEYFDVSCHRKQLPEALFWRFSPLLSVTTLRWGSFQLVIYTKVVGAVYWFWPFFESLWMNMNPIESNRDNRRTNEFRMPYFENDDFIDIGSSCIGSLAFWTLAAVPQHHQGVPYKAL